MFDTENIKTAEDRYDAARRVFEAAVSSRVYLTWFDQACLAYDYVDGNQWGHLTEEERDYMAERKMVPITIDLIGPKLDNVTGSEIQTRTKFKFIARSTDQVERIRAETLTDIAYWLQDRNDSSFKMSMAAYHARVCGLGWHTFDVKGKFIADRDPSPLHMVWDVRDTTPDLSRQGFYAEMEWVPIEDAKRTYKDKAEELASASTSSMLGFGGKWPDGIGSRLLLQDRGGYYAKELDEVLIVKLFYREPAKFYVTNTADKEIVRGFNRTEIEKLAESKDDIDAYDGYKVKEIHFCGSVGLKEGDFPYQLNPLTGEFVATPLVFKKSLIDRVPRGMVFKAIDPQRLYNRKATKLNQLLGARQVIMDENAVEDPESVRQEAASPDGLIVKKSGKELSINDHKFEVQAVTNSMVMHERQVELALGVFSESMGEETNAQSGLAIGKRQAGTNRTHAPFMDKLRAVKKKIGQKQLWLIQRVMTEPMVLSITDNPDAPKLVKLNQAAVDADGKPIMRGDKPIEKLDIGVGEYDVVVEETPDVASQSEEARQSMRELLNAGVPPEKWTPTLLETIGIPITQRKRFEAERQQLVQEQANLKQLGGASAPQGPAGAVPGQQPMNGGM